MRELWKLNKEYIECFRIINEGAVEQDNEVWKETGSACSTEWSRWRVVAECNSNWKENSYMVKEFGAANECY